MVVVEAIRDIHVPRRTVEAVERKGVGHPDFICDSVMEAVAVALSKEYKRLFGAVLHHNIDKGLLAAGKTRKRFGGGRVNKPMELSIGDRATFSVGKKKIDVQEIAVCAARDWIGKNLRFVDPKKHVKYRVALAPGSEELTGIFLRGGKVLPANDTSVLVGYYPLSPTEEAVLALERHLNSRRFKDRYPETGEDIKVMGIRNGAELTLTVAMPLIAQFIQGEQEYFTRKREVQTAIERFAKRFDAFRRINVGLNTLDEEGRGLGGIYLSLLGTSAEDADSGQVGRGNRVNGLITPLRPMSTEAAAGKNCVSHVGKIYNVLAHRAAERIYKEVGGLEEVQVLLVSRIGSPVDEPQMASVRALPKRGRKLRDMQKEITRTLEKELRGIPKLCERLAMGKYPIC